MFIIATCTGQREHSCSNPLPSRLVAIQFHNAHAADPDIPPDSMHYNTMTTGTTACTATRTRGGNTRAAIRCRVVPLKSNSTPCYWVHATALQRHSLYVDIGKSGELSSTLFACLPVSIQGSRLCDVAAYYNSWTCSFFFDWVPDLAIYYVTNVEQRFPPLTTPRFNTL
jgi:hypothetical protein